MNDQLGRSTGLPDHETPSVVVVTASVGRAALRRCAESVQEQQYQKVRHLVVVDGAEHSSGAARALHGISRVKETDVLVLPKNTGGSGHFGYRIYGAVPLLVREDIIIYLDEDNWFDTSHVSSVMGPLESTGASWGYALRKICREDGSLICHDNCDSLGYWPKFATRLTAVEISSVERSMHNRYPHLVDSNCYALPRGLACELAPLWQSLHADSVVASFLVERHVGVCSGVSTVNYALGGGSGTPAEWFTDGNRRVRGLYGEIDQFPWREVPRKLGPGRREHPV